MLLTHTPPPFSASQGHLFFSSPHTVLCLSTSPFFYPLHTFCLHHSLPFSLLTFSFTLTPPSNLLFTFTCFSFFFFSRPPHLLPLYGTSPPPPFLFSLLLLNLPPLLLHHPLLRSKWARCLLWPPLLHFSFYPSSTPFFLIFTFSLLPFSFLSFPLTLRLIFIHPVKAAANNQAPPPAKRRKCLADAVCSVEVQHPTSRKFPETIFWYKCIYEY